MDIDALVRVLMALPAPARAARLRTTLTVAHWADIYRKRTGQAHPVWGNGTLTDTLRNDRRAPALARCGPDYLSCCADVVAALMVRRSDHIL